MPLEKIEIKRGIARGSRLEKYIRKGPQAMKTKEDFVSFCSNVFRDCLNYAKENTKASFPSIIFLNLLDHERFKVASRERPLRAESREESKSPAVAFAVRNSTN